MRSLSSSDTPGSVLTLMVNEPSLNEGKNERPKVKNRLTVNTTSAAVTPNIQRDGLRPKAHIRACSYRTLS